MDFAFVLSSLPEGRLFGVDLRTFIQSAASLVNLGVLATVLAFLLYRPVRDILHKRTSKIEGQLKNAEEEAAKAADLKLLYEQKMEGVDNEREEILGEARKMAAESSRRLVADAKVEADAIKERAAANVEMEWERARTGMRTAIIEVSAVMAEKLVAISINKEAHNRLFAESMADLEGMTWRD